VVMLTLALGLNRSGSSSMVSERIHWIYALAPDVKVHRTETGALLRTSINQTWVDAGELKVLDLLAGSGSSEAKIHEQLRLSEPGCNAEKQSAALLFRLDRLGLLARGVESSGRQIASCLPLRPPSSSPPDRPPEGPLRLSPHAVLRAEAGVVCLEMPASWARMTIHERELLPLLYDLALGRPAVEVVAAMPALSGEAIQAVLVLMSWCGLLDQGDHQGWSTHDLLFHARTRNGYSRVWLGKTCLGEAAAAEPAQRSATDGSRRLALAPPDLNLLVAQDPPFAWVSERRRSVRRQGSVPLTSGQVSEFLFRTLHQREGRRPYPSGGGCYPLNSYVAVHRCLGIAPGLYAYDSARHELITVGESGPDLDRLLRDAAGAANIERTPQVLLVLAARYGRTQRVYGSLSYSLILKEVGAVFQAAMMAAAAMGLSTCPLGCGNTLLFSELVGVDHLSESSVGELMVGSLEENV
jgi:oxazoline/thiazoline dehydrogenase